VAADDPLPVTRLPSTSLSTHPEWQIESTYHTWFAGRFVQVSVTVLPLTLLWQSAGGRL